jgi:hypothetical protein
MPYVILDPGFELFSQKPVFYLHLQLETHLTVFITDGALPVKSYSGVWYNCPV